MKPYYKRLIGEIYSYGRPTDANVRKLRNKCYRQGCSSQTIYDVDGKSDLIVTRVFLVDDRGGRSLREGIRYRMGKLLAAVARKLDKANMVVAVIVEFEKDLAPVNGADIL